MASPETSGLVGTEAASPVAAPAEAPVPVMDLAQMGRRARSAATVMGTLDTEARNRLLRTLADALEAAESEILSANEADLEEARAAGLGAAMIDRLTLDQERLVELAASVRDVAQLPDPVGRDLEDRELDNGMRLIRRAVPLGVVGAIYEARPNVTVDIAVLCLKTGNCCILRGGSETLRTNLALSAAIREALLTEGLPEDCVQLVSDPDRAHVTTLLRLDRYVDMIVPRGGSGLHTLCREQSTIPVMTGGIGICHVLIDETADLERALDVVENAKVQRPTVCNALDTLLVHESIAEALLPQVAARLATRAVELVADDASHRILTAAGAENVRSAGPDDFDIEWLRLTLGIRVVSSIDEGIEHIRAHSTQHSDAILTENPSHAERFLSEVDSATVYVNASTRFTDGGQFGLGAEVAVSTQKLHARGPMGLESLTTYKWIGLGDYHVRP